MSLKLNKVAFRYWYACTLLETAFALSFSDFFTSLFPTFQLDNLVVDFCFVIMNQIVMVHSLYDFQYVMRRPVDWLTCFTCL